MKNNYSVRELIFDDVVILDHTSLPIEEAPMIDIELDEMLHGHEWLDDDDKLPASLSKQAV